jgi:zinc D-Ala-D-Ala dipeptidase
LYRRDPGGAWTQVRRWNGVLGHTGLGWGRGLHGLSPPADRTGPIKKEGDGKSPAGVFGLGGSYGYAAAPPAGAKLAYTQVDASWKCVDDGASASYNRIVDADAVETDWKSAEEMRRKDALYTWVIDVAHNPARTAGDGSCIFLHVWRRAGEGTVGCTAMTQPDLEALLADLDAAQRPVLVQLVAADYDALAAAWQLPTR